VCCQAQHGPTNGIIKDESGKILNARDSDPDLVKNAPLMKEIRATMIKGEWHPECIRCKSEEEAGMRSRRMLENSIWVKGNRSQIDEIDKIDWDDVISKTSDDGTIDSSSIKNSFFDIRFGNLCNLKCRMCGPTDSSQWYNDHAKMWGTSYRDSHGTVTLIKNDKGKYVPEENVYDWHTSNGYWESMESQIPFIRRMYIVGGEPLMIDQHYDFLQRCVDKGHAGQICVEYNSNITNIPKRAYDIWKNFKKIGIGASIDAVGDLNNYIRYPSNFDKIWSNLQDLSRADGNYRIWIAATISVYNILHLPDMIEWAVRNRLPRVNDDDIKPIMSPHPLHGPRFLNVRVLPDFAKKVVSKKFAERLPIIHTTIDECINDSRYNAVCKKAASTILNQYEEFMYAGDYSADLRMFWKHTRRLDAIRSHSIEQFIPDLYNILKETE
jgi:hypothetical protein